MPCSMRNICKVLHVMCIVCMYVYAYIYVHEYIKIYIYIYVSIWVYIYIYICVCIFTCMYTLLASVCVCACTCVHADLYVYVECCPCVCVHVWFSPMCSRVHMCVGAFIWRARTCLHSWCECGVHVWGFVCARRVSMRVLSVHLMYVRAVDIPFAFLDFPLGWLPLRFLGILVQLIFLAFSWISRSMDDLHPFMAFPFGWCPLLFVLVSRSLVFFALFSYLPFGWFPLIALGFSVQLIALAFSWTSCSIDVCLVWGFSVRFISLVAYWFPARLISQRRMCKTVERMPFTSHPKLVSSASWPYAYMYTYMYG